MTRRISLEVLFLFCLSLIIFVWGLDAEEVVSFESRFYLFALEMWQHGIKWFPTTYEQPYPDYPVTATVLVYLTAKLFGGLTKTVAVLPTATASAWVLVLTYLIGAKRCKLWGVSAVCFLLLTVNFLKSTRMIGLDMYVVLITTACFYLIDHDRSRSSSFTWLIYPLFILGFAFRGPIGLIIPTGVVVSCYLLDGCYKKTIITGLLSLFLLSLCTFALIGLAYYAGGDAFMKAVLNMEMVGRINNYYVPIYYYFTNSLLNYALTFPIAIFVLLGTIYYARKHTNEEMRFVGKLFAWMLIILFGMSIPGEKKSRYILPMVPAIALIAGYLFSVPGNEKYFIFLRQTLVRLLLCLPTVVLFFLVFVYLQKIEMSIVLVYRQLFILLILSQALALFFYFYKSSLFYQRDVIVLVLTTVTFVYMYLALIEPIQLYYERAHEFVRMIENERVHADARLVFYKVKHDGFVIKYLINREDHSPPLFIAEQAQLVNFPERAFFITTEAFFSYLPDEVMNKIEILHRGKVGHIEVVVFKRED